MSCIGIKGEYLDLILRIKENKISNAGYQKIFTIKYGDKSKFLENKSIIYIP